MESETIKFLDAWYPVMEAIKGVQEYYNGKNKHNAIIIAPDEVGVLIEAFIKAQLECGVKREITIINKTLDQRIEEAKAYVVHCSDLVEKCKPQDAMKLSTQYNKASGDLAKLEAQLRKKNEAKI